MTKVWHRFRVGDLEITQVSDGARDREVNAGLVKNADVAAVRAALVAAGMPGDRMTNTYTITFARMGGRLVMFDAGNGAAGAPHAGHLVPNMRAAGLDPADISVIVMTHFHPDHVYGLMTADNAQVYPHLEIHVPAEEYDSWMDPAGLASMPPSRVPLAKRLQATLPQWPNIRRHAAGTEILPGIHAIASRGHSPGHTSYRLTSGGHQVMVLGDVTNIPPLNLAHPGWHIEADQDPVTAEETRRRVLDEVAADRIVCTGYHWGMPGAGLVVKHGDGYALDPIS